MKHPLIEPLESRIAPASLSISIVNAQIPEGNQADAGTVFAEFTVTLDVADTQTVSVHFATSDGTATLADGDYTQVNQTVTFAPGVTQQTVRVPITSDANFENDDVFHATLSSPTNATLGVSMADATIMNDDGRPTVSISSPSVTEGGALSFVVSLSAKSIEPITVNYNSADGTAMIADADYTAVGGTLVFSPGQTTKTINVATRSDTTFEQDETLTVQLTGLQNATFANDTGTGKIINDDSALTIDSVTIVEGNDGTKDAVFTVRLSGGPGGPVSVDFATLDGTATGGLDFTHASGTLMFEGTTVLQTITVPIIGDTIQEADETFSVKLSNASGATISSDTGTGTITNDDVANLSVTNFSVPEGNDGPAQVGFVVNLSTVADQDATVHYTTANGTAAAGDDYTATTGTLTIPAGQTSGTVFVEVNGDTLGEPDETFSLVFDTPTNATFTGSRTQTVTLLNDDSPSLSIADLSVTEGTGGVRNAVFVVSLSAPATEAVTVHFATEDGTATAADYTPTVGDLMFAIGERTKTITVPITTDAIAEGNETFTVKLSAATGSSGFTKDSATGTILDDDAKPVVFIDSVSVSEGASGLTTAHFTVTLTGATEQTVTVDVVTQDGTATTADNDYVARATQTLTFAPGVTTQSFDVSVIGDTRGEANETFFAKLSGATNATIGTAQGTGTILNDDAALTIDDVRIVEGDGGTSMAVFTVSLNFADPMLTTTVDFATSDLTATSGTTGTDYDARSGTLTFAPGEMTKQISVPIRGDTVGENDETFRVTLSNAANAAIVKGQGTGTILNDDSSISIGNVSIVEGDSGTKNAVFTVTRSGSTFGAVTFHYTTTDDTAVSTGTDADFNAVSGTGTIAAGATITTISVPIRGDLNKEATEQFFVDLSDSANALISGARGTGTITDNDPNPTVSISDAPAIFEGDSGTTNAIFTVTLSGSSNLPITVNYAAIDGTAANGSDFTLPGGTVTFAPGEVTKQILVPVNGDTIDEIDEAFSVKLSGATNATIGRDTAAGTILNDDLSITIDDNPAIVEGDSGTSNAQFTVHLSAASTHPVTVNYVTSNGTATAGQDYTSSSGMVTFAAGSTTATIFVPIIGDMLDERADETFTVKLSGATAAVIGDDTATGTILNDDANPGLTIDDLTIAEGDTGTSMATFTVHLAKPSTEAITVNYATMDGTAMAGSDYDAKMGTLTFAPGELTKTISVTIHGDTLAEPDETFTVELSDASANSTLAKASGIGTIQDARTISIDNVTKSEGQSGTTVFTFTVSLDANAEQEITVKFATADGTATIAGNDYLATNGMLTFAVGERTKTVEVIVNGDTAVEPDETFNVNLTDATHATLAKAIGVGRIQNDETTFKIVSGSDATSSTVTVLEGSPGATSPTNATFTIVRGGDLSQAGSVQYQTIAGTATAGADFTGTGLVSIGFAPGESTKTISIPITQDADREAQESFTVVLANPVNAAIADGGGTGTVVINDDDGPVTISVSNPAIITEGNTGDTNLSFVVRLSAADYTGPVTVHYRTTDGTAVSTGDAADFLAIDDTELTFAPGETTKTIAVLIHGDVIHEPDLETFSFDLSDATNATIANGHAVGTIRDDDTSTISFSGGNNGDISLAEGNSGTTDFVFTVHLSVASQSTVTVSYTIEDGTAKFGGTSPDYTTALRTGTLTFTPGEVDQTITISALGDSIFEGDETFNVRLSGAVGATISDALAVGTILNDDAAPLLTIGDVTVTEGDSGTTNEVFTVTLSGEFQDSVTVDFATADGTAKDGVNDGITLADYREAHGTLTFLAGQTTKTITVAIVGDLFKEATETFSVNLTNLAGATFANDTDSATGTILDNDTKVGVLIGDVFVVEGNLVAGTQTPQQTGATFQIELTGPSDTDVTFTVATSDRTAIAGSDYIASSQLVTIPAGQTTATFTATVLGDNDFEFGATEAFSAKISGISANATGARTEATGFIYGDDRFISADGRTVKYMDVDGDVGTITISKGRFTGNEFQWQKAGTVGGEQLQFIDLRGATRFANANLRVTGEPAPGFPGVSDGKVNVGFIVAAVPDPQSLQFTLGIDLGTVFIDGDLGRIDAGDTFVSPAIRKLEVGSFGAVPGTLPNGSDGNPLPNTSSVLASISKIIVHGDFAGQLQVFGDNFGDIGSLKIEGALTGALGEGVVFFSGTLGNAVIGSIVGGSVNGSGQVIGNVSTHANINSITVLGAVTGGSGGSSGQIHAERIGSVKMGSLVGGTGINSGTIVGDGTRGRVGTVKILGDIIGAQTLGASDDNTVAATSGTIFGQTGVGNVNVGGSIRGGVLHNSGSIVSSGNIGSVTIGGNVEGGTGTGSGSLLVSNGKANRVQVGTASSPSQIIGGSGASSGILSIHDAPNIKVFGDILGGLGNRSGGIDSQGKINAITVTGNITGGDSLASRAVVNSGYISAAKLGNVTINGNVTAGTNGGAGIAGSGAIRALDTISSLTIKGSVVGNSTNAVQISAGGFRGSGLAESTLVLRSIKLATDTGNVVRFAEILAGYGGALSVGSPRATALNPDAQIGDILIGGTISGTNIVAGSAPGTDGRFGTSDDAIISSAQVTDDTRLISKIASVVIRGAVEPDADPANSYGIVAQQIGSIKVGSAAAIKLPKNAVKHLVPIGPAAANFTAVQIELNPTAI